MGYILLSKSEQKEEENSHVILYTSLSLFPSPHPTLPPYLSMNWYISLCSKSMLYAGTPLLVWSWDYNTIAMRGWYGTSFQVRIGVCIVA